jgi:phenylacetate-coenzyme A ligase PaaK-like adenylate-forming protein
MNLKIDKIIEIDQLHEFNAIALELFHFQAKNCAVYSKYIEILGIQANLVQTVADIPFLPIQFFKSKQVITGTDLPKTFFTSSGTTGKNTSFHYVADLEVYQKSLTAGFGLFFGAPQKYCILGLLPGYLERKESSLVYMVDHLQNLSGHYLNGNYLNEFEKLYGVLNQLEQENQATILFGVTYALLDFGEKYPVKFKDLTIVETGGMKGKRPEITREELHKKLSSGFPDASISSEYGMTELLSQAWYTNDRYHCPPWMKVYIRDKNDPLNTKLKGSGGLNIIDLANLNSCSFIATGDAGIVYDDGSFNVLGRLDNEDMRGCNLMYDQQ